ncbi:MAG: hypothetical protein WCS90_03010 [Bacilli bacterium]
MNLASAIPVFAAYLLGVFLVLFLGPKGAGHPKDPFSFLNHFPYELYGDSRGPFRLFARLGEALALLSEVALPLLLLLSYRTSLGAAASSYLTGLLIFAFLFALSYLLMTLVPASNEKAHLSLFFSSSALSTLSFTMDGLFMMVLIKSTSGKELLYIVVGFLFTLALVTIALPFHPKMKRWAELEQVSEKDGTVSYRRPHFFILAFQEWLLSLFRAVGFVLALFGFLLLSL